MLDIDMAKKLVAEFSRLPEPPKRRKAFLEIIGLNRLESISSNALAFFLDTQEAHGLRDLCLQALLSCLSKQKSDVDIKDFIISQSVETEVTTEERSRIDLLIETDDELIVIENKIHHSANNPFDDYLSYGKKRRGEKTGHYIVLGLDKPKEEIPKRFYFISHFEIGNEIRQRIGEYLTEADQYYVNPLIDYLQAIDSFNPNTRIGQMEQEIVNFYGNNHKQIEKMYEARTHFIEYAEQQAKVVQELFRQNNSVLFTEEGVYDESFPQWVGCNIASENVITHETAKEQDVSYAIFLDFISQGVVLSIYFIEKIVGKGQFKDCQQRLKSILDDLDVRYEDMNDLDDSGNYVIIKRLPWDTTPEKTVEEMLPIIQKIEKALNLDKEA